ncbi:MAG: Ig-like domain-containing protein [Patescibacteria group bacterium]
MLKKEEKIKKIAFGSLLVLLVAIFLLPKISFAQNSADDLLFGGTEQEVGTTIGLGGDDPRIIAARVIRIGLGFLGLVALILIIYAGWLWMTSAGEEDKINQAKKILQNAIIGLIIILMAFAITSFIINKLLEATTGGPPGGGPSADRPGGGLGAIGTCAIESVYPEPFQKEVPRNTAIIVTFKEEVNPATIMDNGRLLTDGQVIIYKSINDRSDKNNWITDVSVTTTDNKTFIFVLDNWLGSPSEYIWYSVYLSNAIEKLNSSGVNISIFSGCRLDYLEWQFEVSNKVDLTPPQVKINGVFPKPGDEKARNAVIQITFNEAIMPITVSGSAEDVKDYIRVVNAADSPAAEDDVCTRDADCLSFDCTNGKCVGDNTYLKGKFIVSSNYRTVEFISDNQCGVNTCGEPIYCLPENSKLKVELEAASLISCTDHNDCVTKSPYANCNNDNKHCQNSSGENYPQSADTMDGIMDLALNSLDGNRDGKAYGPVSFFDENIGDQNFGDNFKWSFSTNDQIDISPPTITSTDAGNNQTGVNLVNPIIVKFSELMMHSSLRTGTTIIDNGKDKVTHQAINLWSKVIDKPSPGFWINSENITEVKPEYTKAEIRHAMFGDNTPYRAQVGSGVKDAYQNCFMPSSGAGCTGDPSCCGGTPTTESECSN